MSHVDINLTREWGPRWCRLGAGVVRIEHQERTYLGRTAALVLRSWRLRRFLWLSADVIPGLPDVAVMAGISRLWRRGGMVRLDIGMPLELPNVRLDPGRLRFACLVFCLQFEWDTEDQS